MSEEKLHAEFSASGSQRWLSCPGSIALSKKAPEPRESPYAAEGTEAHACLEFILKNRKGYSAIGMALKKWPKEMVDNARDAAKWILERACEPSSIKERPDVTLLCETKVDASPFTCEGQFGTLDAAIVEEFGRLVVIDYKYGAGISVDPEGPSGEGNSQLIYYALGISHQYNHNFSEVELVVIQPRAYHESGNTTRSFVLSIEELLAWEPVFKAGVDKAKWAALAPEKHLASGSWCKFCPAAPICPELKDKAFKQAQIVFADETGIESVPEPKTIAIPNLGTVLSACDKLEEWIGKVREHAVHVLERGHDVEGWKLVQKRSIRKWRDETEATLGATLLYGLDALTSKVLSPAQLERKFAGEKSLDDFIAGQTTSESSGTTLVPESDKREAVRPVAAVFAEPAVKALPAALQGKLTTKGRKNGTK